MPGGTKRQPNTYPYKGTTYSTCDCFFLINAPGFTGKGCKLQEDEIGGFRMMRPDDLRREDFAFASTWNGLLAFREAIKGCK
jgi:hypothetical protein